MQATRCTIRPSRSRRRAYEDAALIWSWNFTRDITMNEGARNGAPFFMAGRVARCRELSGYGLCGRSIVADAFVNTCLLTIPDYYK